MVEQIAVVRGDLLGIFPFCALALLCRGSGAKDWPASLYLRFM
jgi:hypothetical protein